NEKLLPKFDLDSPLIPEPLKPAVKEIPAARALGLWARWEKAGVEVSVGVLCADAPRAKKVADTANDFCVEHGGQGVVRLLAGPLLRREAVAAAFRELVDSVRFRSEGDLALASARLRVQSFQALLKDALSE